MTTNGAKECGSVFEFFLSVLEHDLLYVSMPVSPRFDTNARDRGAPPLRPCTRSHVPERIALLRDMSLPTRPTA